MRAIFRRGVATSPSLQDGTNIRDISPLQSPIAVDWAGDDHLRLRSNTHCLVSTKTTRRMARTKPTLDSRGGPKTL